MSKTPMTAPAALLELPDPIVDTLEMARERLLKNRANGDAGMEFWCGGYIRGTLNALLGMKILDLDEKRELCKWFLREEETDEQEK